MFKLVIIIHVLAATVWTGGHIFLATMILPKVLRTKNYKELLDFERIYEKIGMPALILQVITGLYLSYKLLPNISKWLSFKNHVSQHIGFKLILLGLTIILAVIANFILIPNLKKNNNLKIMAFFVYTVTIIAVLFVITGLSFRLNIL